MPWARPLREGPCNRAAKRGRWQESGRQSCGDNPSDPREGRIQVGDGRLPAEGIGRNHNGGSAVRPDHRIVARRPVIARAGLVGHAPAGGHAGAQALQTGSCSPPSTRSGAAREPGDSTSPSSRRRRLSAMARGVVVSRSPGAARFSAPSMRSRRVVESPMARSHAVRACGPPRERRIRLAAPLSLTSSAAWHRVASGRPLPCRRPPRSRANLPSKGALCGHRARSGPDAHARRPRGSGPCATARALKVLHIRNRSSARHNKV